MADNHHPRQDFLTRTPARELAPVSSPVALHEPELWLPLQADIPTLDETLARVTELDAETVRCRERNDIRTAERTEQEVERLLREAEDPDALPTVYVNEPDGGRTALPTPRWCDLATWLFRTADSLPDDALDALLTDQERDLLGSFAEHLACNHGLAREIDDQTAAGYVDREIKTEARNNERALAEMLELGLQLRLRQPLLGAELAVYRYLTAIGIRAHGVRVCHDCTRVYAGKSARRCPTCTHAPVRVSPRPWHLAIRPADPAVTEQRTATLVPQDAGTALHVTVRRRPGPTITTYASICEECGGTFTTSHAHACHCKSCAKPASRTARSRARRTASLGAR